jgi:hypothetical protein
MLDNIRGVGWLVVGLSVLGIIMLLYVMAAITDDLLDMLEKALNES